MSHLDDGLRRIRELGGADRWLAVLTTLHPERAHPDVAVVNAGIVDHPATGRPVVGFVARPGRKITNLRANGMATLVFRSGWEWVAVRGSIELAGPDDPHPRIDDADAVELRRVIFNAAGGRHPDLDRYDEVMVAERRVAVLVEPERFWSNPPGAQHQEPQETEEP